MLVLLLLRPHVGVGRAMRAQLAAAVAPVLPSLAAQVVQEVDSANGWHRQRLPVRTLLPHPFAPKCYARSG